MQRCSTVIAALTVSLLSITSSSLRGAGSDAAEEAAIRKVIAAADHGTVTAKLADRIFWSGATKRPTVGSVKGEPYATGGDSADGRVPGSQKTKTEVMRIVVADSHDLAYEYSKSTLDFDLKSGKHVSFDTGLLRVWQKQAGEWKEAATFVRPYDVNFVER
jgi:ketosteroid isomerase-like protein